MTDLGRERDMPKGGEQVVLATDDPFPGAHGVEEIALARPGGGVGV